VALKLSEDFPDGTANTIMIIEAGEAVPWNSRPIWFTCPINRFRLAAFSQPRDDLACLAPIAS